MSNYDVNKNYKEVEARRVQSEYFGQWETDRIIEEYFPGKKDGLCIDVGAADGVRGSNTYYFEKLGWRCICVEPNPEYMETLHEHRLIYMNMACADKIGYQNLTVFKVGEHSRMSSLTSLNPDERLVEDHKHLINESYKVKVPVTTLTRIATVWNLFKKTEVIDFISIDTEGTELNVLKGFDFSKFNVTLFIVENNYNDVEIEDYMNKHGYRKDQRYKINDFYVKDT